MRHLISALLFVCSGTSVTWLTASLIEFNAVTRINSAQAYFAEPPTPTNSWDAPTIATKAPVAAALAPLLR
jgi:hypothetical protein